MSNCIYEKSVTTWNSQARAKRALAGCLDFTTGKAASGVLKARLSLQHLILVHNEVHCWRVRRVLSTSSARPRLCGNQFFKLQSP